MPEKTRERKTKNSTNRGTGSPVPPSEDDTLWERFTHDITPLHQKTKISAKSSKKPEAPKAPPREKLTYTKVEPKVGLRSEKSPVKSSSGGVRLDSRTLSKLERGDMAIDGTIDLHGLSEHGAHISLSRFLGVHIENGSRCLLIITGKGQNPKTGDCEGIIRSKLPVWLETARFASYILALRPAQRKHGGRGAFYLLLRRQRASP